MYTHIMVPLDGSRLAECVLPHVEALVQGFSIGNVTLVRVVEPFTIRGGLESRFSPEEIQRLDDDRMKLARNYLEPLAKQLTTGEIVVKPEVLHGDVIDCLVDYADKNKVDLIVIATHGRSGISRWAWGSTADRILRTSCVPVMMVRAPGCVPGI